MKLSVLDKYLLDVQKPAQYIGGEFGSIVKEPTGDTTRFAFCFPDVYTVGMSHLGMKILYGLLNKMPDVWCERVFAPDKDFEAIMRENKIPLYALESLEPIKDFDIIGFTLQYELSFTSIINMLDLAGIEPFAKDRTSLSPLVIAGGPCACNPEPIADFIDIFLPGEGEEVLPELVRLYQNAKKNGLTKLEFLKEAVKIEGVYVPSFYEVEYNPDGTIKAIKNESFAPQRVKKRIVEDLSAVYYPESFVVPFIQTVHDRAMLEVMRGCLRGCRFCQAGFIYRPQREKNIEGLVCSAKTLCKNTGYEEISLTSLSTSDYKNIEPLLNEMTDWSDKEKVSLSLPSLRIDNFSPEIIEKISSVRKSGLTFAPEAGSQRLRDAINKNISEKEIFDTCRIAFESGYTSVKLYFMLGLPTETMDDVKAIAELAQKIVDLYYSLPARQKGQGVNVNISTAVFIPKPFTPFEFEPQDRLGTVVEKQKYLTGSVTTKKVKVNWHDGQTSILEAALARGDRRLGKVLYAAWQNGSTLDAWSEHFDMVRWIDAFAKNGLSMDFYANRRREYDEIMPWSILDYGVTKEFLIEENKKAHQSETTPHCRQECSSCGASQWKGGVCFE